MSQPGPLILALDMGGTRFRVALASKGGKLLDRRVHRTQAGEGPAKVIGRITMALRSLLADGDLGQVRGMGVAVPGPVDSRAGILLTPPNLPGWQNVPLKSTWEQEFGIPVFVGNDANLAALGEHRFGAGMGVENMIYLTISTGIGGGVISGGRLLLGAGGLAGEVGHMTIDRNGPACNCGNVGCWETLASGTAIARLARERLSRGESSALVGLSRGDPASITAEMVEQAARSGDALALGVMAEVGAALGVGVVNLVHLFNPGLIVIGGGVARSGEMVFGPIHRAVAERAMPPFRKVRIVPAALGDDAGLLGAAALVLDNM